MYTKQQARFRKIIAVTNGVWFGITVLSLLYATPIRNDKEQAWFFLFPYEHVRQLAQRCDSTLRFEEKRREVIKIYSYPQH
jgi:hypothetical protein